MQFDELKDAIFAKLDEVESDQKKITQIASPLLKLLRNFAIFNSQVDNESIARLSLMLSGEGNSGDYGKICRIFHFLVSEIGLRCGPATIQKLIGILKEDLENDNESRNHAAIRTIGYLESKTDGLIITKYLIDKFKDINPSELTGSKDADAMANIYYTTINKLCKIYSQTPSPFLKYLCEGSTMMDNDFASRECLSALYSSSMNHPKETYDAFKSNLKEVNLNNPINCIYYYRTICMLSLSNLIPEGDRNTLYDILINGLNSTESLQVLLEICKLLFRFSWEKLQKNAGSKPAIQQILDKLYEYTNTSSENSNTIELYCICSVWCIFGRIYVRSNDKTNNNIQVTFNKVINIINNFVKPEISNALLSRYMSTVMWLLPAPEGPENEKLLQDFIKLISSFPSDNQTVRIIMDSLTPRLMITTSFCIHFLKLISTWCPDSRDSLSSNTMSTLWIHSSPKEPAETLTSIFHVLDLSVEKGEGAWRIQRLHCAAYWVLGEAWKNFVVDTKREKFYNSDKQGWDLFDSPVVRNILVRLIEAIHLGNWIIRRCAISSIIKISLICKDPLKIKLYEFLLNLKDTFYAGSGTCVDDLIDTALDALDCYYESLSDESKQPQYEKRLQLFAIATE